MPDEIWKNLLDEMQSHLKAHGYSLTDDQIKLSPMLEVDVKAEKFVGPHAAAANALLQT